MALQNELLIRLNNEEEPLSKRLRLAKNVFKTSEFPVHRKENIIFNWLCNNGISETQIWPTISECLTSNRMSKLNMNDLDNGTKTSIIKIILKQLENGNQLENGRYDIINASICICNNESMHYFFKMSLIEYSKFITTLLCKISTKEHAEQILDSIFVFQKKILDKTLYYNVFLYFLPSLSRMVTNLENDVHIFNEVSKLIGRVLFSHNLLNSYKSTLNKNFSEENIETEEEKSLLKDIMMKLHKLYMTSEKNEVLTSHKCIFHSFTNSYKSETQMIFQLFILLNTIIGFKFDDLYECHYVPKMEINLNLSLLIINEQLKTVADLQVNDMKVGDCTFNNYIQKLITKIIKKTKIPFLISFDIFCNMIAIDPIAVESKLNELIIYIILHNKETTSYQNEYTRFMKCFLEMFSKLHREQKFIAKFLKCLNSTLNQNCENNIFDESILLQKIVKKIDISSIRLTDILSPAVTTFFGKLFENFSSSQFVSMLRTFNFELNDNIVKVIEPSQCDLALVLLTEIEVELMIIFLNNVTIAEHTVPTPAFERYKIEMDELKRILSEFGKKLLNMEHNCDLMAAYLNLCYTWGELSILILHYAPSEKSSVNLVPYDDISVRNFTYLHSYLTVDQWNSIIQRINNFGEYKCKRLMHKFLIQKIRAMLLFNTKISNEAKTSYNKSLLDSIEETKSLIISNDVISTDCIFPLLSTSQLVILAESFVNEVIEKQMYRLLLKSDFQERRKFVLANIVICIKKLSSVFKLKRKHDSDDSVSMPFTRKVISNFELVPFVDENEEYLEKEINDVSKLFCKYTHNNNEIKINFNTLSNYLRFLSNLPLSYCSKNVKTLMFFVFFALRIDIKNTNKKKSITVDCEKLLIDILEGSNSPNMMLYISYDLFYENIPTYTYSNEIITFLVENSLKNKETIQKLKYGLKYIKKNITADLNCLQIITIIFKCVSKVKKASKNVENKVIFNKYKRKCIRILITLLESEHKHLPENMIEFYGLALQNSINEKFKKYTEKLFRHLNIFLNHALSEKNPSEITWKFLEVLLRNKHDLNEYLPDKFIPKCQKICKKSPTATIALIFEIANNEQFSELLDDLLKTTKAAWLTNDEILLAKKLNIWKSIINSSLNAVKQTKRQSALGELLNEMLFYLKQNPPNNIDFCKKILNLASELAENKNIVLSNTLIDTLLIIVSNIELDSIKMESFLELFTKALQVIDLLFAYRNAMILDKLPSFLSRFRYLLNSLCIRSNVSQNLKPEDISFLSSAAHGIEKLVLKMVRHKKDFVRLAPYLIPDILKYYETITFYLPIKNHLNNCLYALINICDVHAIPFLNRSLSVASQELFKKSYDEYKKYYRFVGKI